MRITTNYATSTIIKNGKSSCDYNHQQKSKYQTHPPKDEFSALKGINFKSIAINKPTNFTKRLENYKDYAKQLSPEDLKVHIDNFQKALKELETKKNNKNLAIHLQPWWKFKRKAPQYNKIEEDYAKERFEKIEMLAVATQLYETAYYEAHNAKGNLAEDIANHRMSTSRAKAYKDYEDAKNKYYENTGFASLAGYEEEKKILEKFVIMPIHQEKAGINSEIPGSILFFGPQGNGKSSFASALAQEADTKTELALIKTNIKDFDKVFLKNLQKQAELAEKHYQDTKQRTIIIVDEIDTVTDEYSSVNKALENFLDTCSEKYHCTIFATTNYPEKVKLNLKDNNQIFPVRVGIDPPNITNKAQIMEYYAKDRIIENIDFEELAQKIEEREKNLKSIYSNAFLEQIVLDATTKEEIINNINNTIPNITEKELHEYQEQLERLSENKIVL